MARRALHRAAQGARQPRAGRLATHLAACDVALNPPCLPTLLVDRQALDLEALHPVGRWRRSGNDSATRSSRRTDIDDALRCADHICAALGWTSVSTVVRTAARMQPHGLDD